MAITRVRLTNNTTAPTVHKDVTQRLAGKQRPAPKRMFSVRFVSAIP